MDLSQITIQVNLKNDELCYLLVYKCVDLLSDLDFKSMFGFLKNSDYFIVVRLIRVSEGSDIREELSKALYKVTPNCKDLPGK